MADKSSIEWTEATLNAWTGCRKKSAGCARCYIGNQPPFRIAGRKWVRGATRFVDADGNTTEDERVVVYHLERIDRMVRRKKPTLYFVNSLSDVFLEDVPPHYIARLWAGMTAAPQHTFQVLTKRPERMQAMLHAPMFYALLEAELEANGWIAERIPSAEEPLPNVWVGVTVENRAQVKRADLLRATPAAVRFLSCEPLLGPVVYDARDWRPDPMPDARFPMWEDGAEGKPQLDLADIDWVIAGGESGPNPRPCREEWLRDLRDAVIAENRRRRPNTSPAGPFVGELESYPMPPRRCRFFLKQMGSAWATAHGADVKGGKMEFWPEDLRIRTMPPLPERAVPDAPQGQLAL